MENWKPVVNLPGYLVSDQGRVARLLSDTPSARTGYVRVNLGGKVRLVHQLVLEAFRGPRPVGHLSRHLNDIKTDNRLQNLVWGTPSENIEDAFDNGGRVLFARCPLGHPIKGKNLQVRGRRCKACNRARAQAHRTGEDFVSLAEKKYQEVIG